MGALGAVGGGVACIAKAVNDAKAKQQQLEEQKRHDAVIEMAAKGKGLYLRPSKGYSIFLRPFKKLPIKLLRRALTDQEIEKLVI